MIIRRALRQLIPQNIFGDQLLRVIDALANALSAAYDAAKGIIRESVPSQADETLQQWYDMLGIPREQTLPLELQQKIAKQAWTASGGQSKEQLDEQIQIAFPDVEVVQVTINLSEMVPLAECGVVQCFDYPSWYGGPETGEEPIGYYFVVGDVEQFEQFQRLIGLISRIGPAEMEPVFQIAVASDTETSQCGIAQCNLAECNAE